MKEGEIKELKIYSLQQDFITLQNNAFLPFAFILEIILG